MDHRTERVSDALREELTELISYEMADPRVSTAIVTDVQVSPDKRRALVRIAVAPGEDPEAALSALEHGKSFLRRQLAARLDIFRIPDLTFETDTAAMLGDRLPGILKRIRKGRPKPEPGQKDASK